MTDGRRRRWLPLSSRFPRDNTGLTLLEEFGNSGLVVWVAFLTACKRNPVEGQFSYSSEEEAWIELGVQPCDFTLKEFFDVTGRLHVTRRQNRRGRLVTIVATTWSDWKVRPHRGADERTTSGPRADHAVLTSGPRGAEPQVNPNKYQPFIAPYKDQDHDQDHDIDHHQDPPGLVAAIEEAKNDPKVDNPEGAGRWRYENNPAKYNELVQRLADHAGCSQCDGSGEITHYPQSGGTTKGPCPG